MRPKGCPKRAELLYAPLDCHWFWLYKCVQTAPMGQRQPSKVELQVPAIVSTAKHGNKRPATVSVPGKNHAC